MLRGSCACDRIHYEIRGDFISPITYCHCWRCRKHSGSSFGTTVGIKTEALVFLRGGALLASWESSPGIHRFFAGCCGSPLYKRDDAIPNVLGFRLGTLDTDPGRKADCHFSLNSKAPWVELSDALPQDRSGVSFGERD